jgi:hypothetical protein
MKPVAQQLVESKRSLILLAIIGFVILPLLYSIDLLSIGQINMIGRYMTFAILALGLDLLWGLCRNSESVSVYFLLSRGLRDGNAFGPSWRTRGYH